jgi:putative hemolysin
VPVWFSGQNSRLFQIASHVSYTLRISLLFHEVRSRIGTALPVVIGAPIPFCELQPLRDRQALADHLRDRVYALAKSGPTINRKPNAAERLLKPVRAALKAERAA